MCFKVSFWKRFFRLLVVITVGACLSPSLVLAGTDTLTLATPGNKTISFGTTENDKQKIDDNNYTLTNNGTIVFNANRAVQTTGGNSGITIINNAGGRIATTAGAANKDYAIYGQSETNLTIINSGTIESMKKYAIDVTLSTGTVITNNAGGIITAATNTVYVATGSSATNTTITNSGKIYVTGTKQAINLIAETGTVITNNAGGEIYRHSSVTDTGEPVIALGADASITNSGQIRADNGSDKQAIRIRGDNSTFTNNSGGSITGYVENDEKEGITFTNYGTISSSFSDATFGDQSGDSSGTTMTNHAGGVISNTSTGDAVRLVTSGTFTNSGTVQNTNSTSNNAIRLDADNNTVILKDEGKVIGLITADAGTTGNKLQFGHGFGRAYFYETSGDLTLEDLSGNTVVKGSAGSVSLGRQETVDELLGLRAFNLRSALKRYASAPKPADEDTIWGETFGYSSKRGGTDTLLKYDTYGYGMNFIHPVTSKLDLILSVERNELDFPEEYDVSRTGFLAGVNVSEFSGFRKGNWKLGGFVVAGMGWHNSKREILTNTTTSGLLDVTADYKSMEIITGFNFNHSYQSPSKGWMKNKWDTEMGLTFQGSHTGDYNERHYFFFEERTLVQESIHLGEQLTSTFNDRLGITLGLEYEFRLPIGGKKQTYRINGTPTDYTDGSFTEHSGSGNLGLNYRFGGFGPSESRLNQGLAYIQLSSRLSDENRGTYGGSFGIRLNF